MTCTSSTLFANTVIAHEFRRKQRSSYPNDERTLKKSYCSRHAFTRSKKRQTIPKEIYGNGIRCSVKPPGLSYLTALNFRRAKRSKYHFADPNMYHSGMSILSYAHTKLCNHLEIHLGRKTMRNFSFSFTKRLILC